MEHLPDECDSKDILKDILVQSEVECMQELYKDYGGTGSSAISDDGER